MKNIFADESIENGAGLSPQKKITRHFSVKLMTSHDVNVLGKLNNHPFKFYTITAFFILCDLLLRGHENVAEVHSIIFLS